MRNRAVLGWLAVSATLFAGAWAVSLLEPDRAGIADPAASLGGARTVMVASLFLRAEKLRGEGRFDELPAIYRRILELDPASESAIDHLAETLSHDLRATAPTAEGRVRWWTEAEALVVEALKRSPTSVRLLWRRADLLLVVGNLDPAVAEHLARAHRDREAEAVASLREAARLSGDVPRLGRIHLVLLASALPSIAAERLARGDDAEPFLSAGADVLRWRAPEFAELVLGVEPPYVHIGAALQAGLLLVAGVRDALHQSPAQPERAREMVTHYAAEFGEDRVVKALRPLVR